MEAVEKRRKFIINTVYVFIILGLFYLFMKYAFWMFAPFIFALAIAMLMQRPVNFLTRKTHVARGLVSSIMVLLVVFGLGTIVTVLFMRVFSELKGFFHFMMMKMEDAPVFIEQMKTWVQNGLSFLPQGITDSVVEATESFFTKLLGEGAQEAAEVVESHVSGGFDLSVLSSPLGAIWGTAKQIPMFAISVLVAIVSSCFMTADYHTIRNIAMTQAGEKAPTLVRTKKIVFQTIGKMAKAYTIIILVTMSELMIGLTILKALGLFDGGYIFAIALITAVIDIVPVLGTGTVLVPWAIWSFITKDIGMGVGILIIYAVISIVRQIIEPKLVAAQLGLPAFITLMAMYIGSQLFGFIGLFLLPIILMILKVLNDEEIIHLYKKMSKDETPKKKKGGIKFTKQTAKSSVDTKEESRV